MTIAVPPPDRFDFAIATTAINAWRGRCIAAFTRAEVAVTEALAKIAERDLSVGLPYLTGQRFAVLETTLAQTDDPAAPLMCEALSRFRRHLQLRTFLCHGDTTITIDRRGRWQVVFTVVSLRGRRAHRETLVIAQNQAEGICNALRRAQQQLVTSLSQFRSTNDQALMLGIGAA